MFQSLWASNEYTREEFRNSEINKQLMKNLQFPVAFWF